MTKVEANKVVIYSGQRGESCVPVTVRIEWRSDGTIRPLTYWTPDHACFQVLYIYECTPIAYLKDRGDGLRFKVRAEITETPETDDDLLYAQRETYLYFIDNRFCERNIIDNRYGHEGKEFIPVTMDVFPNCDYELISFTVQTMRYMVEKTIAIEPRGSFHAGGIGVCHTVEVRKINTEDDGDRDPLQSERRVAALYFEINKWFVAKTIQFE